MKVHPAPDRRNTTVHYNQPNPTDCRQKNLRRLPHIFAKVLELPFYSDADVTVHETPESLRFVVDTDDHNIIAAAHAIEIYPGVTKVVVGGGAHEMEIDVWRFRLPECTVPELATASFSHGELVVVVPKEMDSMLLYST
ncbi:uncharacterized protein LOC143618418 [Bidens hawaiensis]|uniref:uncharacterized protein LOC143618418 n=1 Tax=Bidens hawaiensis TaxID=980011 RepID=UPI00404A2E59